MRLPIIRELVRLSVRNIRNIFIISCVILHNFMTNMGMGCFEDVGDAAGLEAQRFNAAGG